jgi:uroporphyrinogen decarboxylase
VSDPVAVRPRHDDSAFVRACRGLPHEHVPVWFMRQAGRALPEYRAVRDRHSFEEVVQTPELAAEVTLQPVRRYGVDAAILFSDIVTPVQGLGIGVEIAPGVGPVVAEPFRTNADLERLRPLEPDMDVPYVLDTVSLLVAELDVPLIGFAGAPFTLASYLIEGGPSRSYTRTKALMFSDELTWHRLLDRLAGITLASLRAQVDRGAAAVQLFDSWAGALAPADYERFVLPHSRRVLEELHDHERHQVPRIHFGVGTGELLGLMGEAGADVVGVDWRVPLDAARRASPPVWVSRATSSPPSCSVPGPASSSASATSSTALRAGRTTSSTSATACCPHRPRRPGAGRRARARRGSRRGGPGMTADPLLSDGLDEPDEPTAIAVALLGGASLAGPLSERTGLTVVATSEDDHLEVAEQLSAPGVLVVGLAAVPWPTAVDLHADGSASLPAYTGVVSWHALPLLLDRLAQAVAPGAAAGAHVLITSPDPGPDTDPGDVTFLREVAEGIADRVTLSSRSIAWRGTTRTPTAVDALTSVVEVHGRRDVVELPVAPGTGPDPALTAAAEQLGARLTCVDLGRATLLDVLTAVIGTVAEHEGLA